MNENRERVAGADRQKAGDRSYRIGLCAARSMARSEQEREQFARELQRWLMLSPAPATERVEGAVLGLGAARRSAIWIHFADHVMRVVILIAVVTIILAISERDWWTSVELAIVVGLMVASQYYSLRNWYAALPGLLPWLPAAGTPIAVGAETLAVGDAEIPYAQIRFDHIRLRKQRGFMTRFWESEYFLDHVTLRAGGKIIHLDAAAINNGQQILDTLCSRVPLAAYDR